jgi:hypothetical protein
MRNDSSANFKTTEIQRRRSIAYYYANREAILARYKMLSDEIRERRRQRTRAWRSRNKETKSRYDKSWRASNRVRWQELQRKQRREPKTKLLNNLRKRLRDFLQSSSGDTSNDFGCSPKQLRAHIERQFNRGMSWETYGRWHVDHIVPCSAFDLTEARQIRICFNWQNLRPLWGAENVSKASKLVHPQLHLPLSVLK